MCSVANVKIDFLVDGTAGTFERSGSTGRAIVRIGDEYIMLQSPWNPLTHFELSTTKTWKAYLIGHEIVIVKERPRIVGGLRKASFTVFVDGQKVASQVGR